MGNNDTKPLRVSAVNSWATCEAMALADPRQESRVGIAAWVGTLAHALLAGQPEPPEPRRFAFDTTTRTAHEARIQAAAIAECARGLLAAHGYFAVEAETAVYGEGVTGHIDIIAWASGVSGDVVIDLKTGQDVGAAWLQVGGYLDTLSRVNEGVSAGGVLHVPRQRIGRDVSGTLAVREAGPLIAAWRARVERIRAVQGGAVALRSPGRHCARCSADCPVRTA